jgi:hypothetical protein
MGHGVIKRRPSANIPEIQGRRRIGSSRQTPDGKAESWLKRRGRSE